MNDSTKNNHSHTSHETKDSKENPIPAKDSSRNEERDQRIKQEQDTERLRSERQSVQDNKTK